MAKKRIVLILCLILLPKLSTASAVRYLKPQKLINQATAIAIATIITSSEEATKCVRIKKATLKATKYLKGHLPNNAVLELTDINHILAPECRSVHFIRAPYVHELTKDKEVIVTIKKVKGQKNYKVTSTYELTDLAKIKEMIAN